MIAIKDSNGDLVPIANKSDVWQFYNTKQAAEDALANGEIAEGNIVATLQNSEEPYNPNYSTVETKTGATWIDGKPIYRKVVSLGAMPSSATTSVVNHGIQNIDIMTNVTGIMVDKTNKIYVNIPFLPSAAENNTGLNIYANETQVLFSSWGMDRSSFIGYAILEYTKTTD